MNVAVPETSKSPLANPWVQLVIGVICMACVANLQYGWTLFVNPIDAKYHWGRAAIQVAFTIFVLIETWLVPVEGYLVDKYGPRVVVLGGAVLVAIAWVMNSMADTLTMLYIAAAIGGVGVGSVYGTCVGNALKWFPGRRGLAAGFTAAGFGAGAALSIVPIKHMIDGAGYEQAFLTFGIGQGIIVFIMAWGLMVAPASLTKVVLKVNQSARQFAPMEVIRKPVFWVMYVMFMLVASGVLMMAASMAPIAKDLHVEKLPVELFGLAMPALTFALTLNRYFDGFGRPFFGWVSDRIGRENTMGIAFSLGAVALYSLSQSGSNPVLFVIITALYFGVSGEIYSLFPATQGDTFGAKFAAANAGMLYTAKGAAALVVPAAAALAASSGWHTVFTISSACNLAAAGIGLFLLKPMRKRHFAEVRAQVESAGAVAAV
jgi:OFA family oxalate/formate antiporter-like MFS transporter